MIARRFLLLFFLPVLAFAQKPRLEPGQSPSHPDIPTVTFTVEWPGGQKPQHYSLKEDSTGRAAYSSVDDAQDTGEPYTLEFTVTDATRNRIFSAAKELNDFNGNFDFTKHRVAFTGTKTLSYADPTHFFQTSYNWSENAELMQLTRLLQGICATIAYGQRLDYMQRFDRLSLNAELKGLEEAAQQGFAVELHSIQPVLRSIADNAAVMDLARERARRLLRLAAQETFSGDAPH